MTIMKKIMLAKLVKNIVISFSLHIFPRMRKSVFFWLFLLVTNLFCSRSYGRRFRFSVDGIGVLDGFIDGINSLFVNTFCKLLIALVSVIPILQNILFWYQFTLKKVSVILFFMLFR